jgi:hypothetical protein
MPKKPFTFRKIEEGNYSVKEFENHSLFPPLVVELDRDTRTWSGKVKADGRILSVREQTRKQAVSSALSVLSEEISAATGQLTKEEEKLFFGKLSAFVASIP